ncbi:RNA polymerase sigma factor [Fulvivirga sp. RKSG066]|uniref:RNA polymerase sigma factor n=1 Tax=Fulvivirga aurantia TaxID=2529383 RepID=UPI0012BBB60D|nr:RNA polymerase sigma factor [Fulvivirga aurantia]MTI21809.1 RNA polymerase sigma factor [Fulvivirga aurantia]
MTDEALMLEVKNGDLKKASILFDRYHKRLYNFFLKISFDKELGHDLTQNTFLRLIKYRKTYKEGSKFQSWVYQMARNIYADHYRKNKVLISDYDEVDEIKNKLELVDETIVQDEREKLLYISLFRLTPEQREVLILTRFQQMKYEEVAQVLETSVANVKVKVHRAIKALRDKYLELEKI